MSFTFSFCCKRKITVFSALAKSYYETLGVNPKATQADIKAAYYKLSMVYHPDKNQGSQVAAEKFRLISAAYEVLGNYDKRKLYDKGLLVERNVDHERPDTRSESIFQRKRPTYTGRTPIYDFDEWSKSHYGQSFARRSAAKAAYDEKMRSDIQQERDGAVFGLLLILSILIIVSYTVSENSLDRTPKKKNDDVKTEDTDKKN